MMLASFGKRWGVLAAGITTALDTMHPNDSFGQQVAEGLYGLGLGYGTGKVVQYGYKMENKVLGYALGSLAFLAARLASHGNWPNDGYGEKPDIDKLFSSAAIDSTPAPLPSAGETVPGSSGKNQGDARQYN